MPGIDPEQNVIAGHVQPTAPKHVAKQARIFAQSIIESEDYRLSLHLRAKTGSLPPAVEVMLWAYAYGKPTEKIEIADTRSSIDLSTLTTQQLSERAAMIAGVLKDTADAKAAAEAVEDAQSTLYAVGPSAPQ